VSYKPWCPELGGAEYVQASLSVICVSNAHIGVAPQVKKPLARYWATILEIIANYYQ
jgi:hypothetical protein